MTETVESWTIQKVIEWTTKHFQKADVSSARLDAELLLAHILDCKRLDLYLKFDQPLKAHELTRYRKLIERRANHEPTAYITETQEFYGRSFHVGPGVLIPRPETEQLVDKIIEKSFDAQTILDVGAGSGCIGLTLALELSSTRVTLVDNSLESEKFSSLNTSQFGLGARAVFMPLSFEEFSSNHQFDVVVANPPYVGRTERDKICRETLLFEPEAALFGGEDGFETIKEWMPKLAELVSSGKNLFVEIGFDQSGKIEELANRLGCFSAVKVEKDYSGHSRFLSAIKKTES